MIVTEPVDPDNVILLPAVKLVTPVLVTVESLVPVTEIPLPAVRVLTPALVTTIAVVPLTLIPEPATTEVIAEEAPVVAQYVGLLLGVRFTLAPKREI